MFCKNCGKEISSEAQFCPACGQPVSSAPINTTPAENTEAASQTDTTASVADTTASAADTTTSDFSSASVQNTIPSNSSAPYADYTQPAYDAPEPQPSMMMPKKNGKKIAAIVAAVILVALIATGVAAHAQIANFVKRTFSSPASYYNYVEKKNLKTGQKNLVENYKKYEEAVNGTETSKSATYKLELGTSAKTMLSMMGIDFSAFESAEISSVGHRKDNTTIGQTKILLNGNDAVTANIYADMDAKEYYLQIPELSDAYLSLSSIFQTPANGETNAMQDIMLSIGEYIPTSEQMEALYTTYTNLVVDKLTNVEKSTDILEADGISQKCTVLKVTATGKEVYEISKTFLDTAKQDENLKSVMEKIDNKVDNASVYEDFQSMLDDMATNLEASKDTMESSTASIVMDVFVNNSGDIVGRTVSITADDGETFHIVSHMPESGSKFGYEMSITSNDTTYLTITGNGTRKGGKMSGEFSISLDESMNPSTAVIASMQDIVTVNITDLDEDALEDGYLNGTISFQCNAIAFLSTYSLEIKAESDKNQSTFAMSVLCADDNLATISMEIKDAEAPSVERPTDSDTVYDITNDSDMETFKNSLDIDAFLQDIQTKSGIDFSNYVSMIESLIEGANGTSDDDYNIDDYDFDDYDFDDYNFDDYDLDDYNFDDYDLDDYNQEDDITIGSEDEL